MCFRFYSYFTWINCVAFLGESILVGLITVQSFLPGASSENKLQFFSRKTPLKTKLDGLFMMMSLITTLFVGLLASAILVFVEYYLRSRMKDIHHTILKTIGGFGYFLALFSIISRVVILFDPTHDWNIHHNHTWIRYLAISICLCVTLVAFYFFWKKVCKYQQEELEGPVSFAVLGFVPLPVGFVFVLWYSELIGWLWFLCLLGVIFAAWFWIKADVCDGKGNAISSWEWKETTTGSQYQQSSLSS